MIPVKFPKSVRKEMIREFNEMRDVKLQKKLAMQERGMEKILTFLERFNKDKK